MDKFKCNIIFNCMKKVITLVKRGINAYLKALAKYPPTGVFPFGI